MWYLGYYVDKVDLKEVNDDTILEQELSSDRFLEGYLFGDGISLYASKKINKVVNKIKDTKFIEEKMVLDDKVKKTNHLKNNYNVIIRNYYDFTDDGIIYISSSCIYDLEVR